MYLSYLMGAANVGQEDLAHLGAEIPKHPKEDVYLIKVSDANIESYKALVRAKLTPSFWNEMVGETGIYFIFKFKDGSLKEFVLSSENEVEIGKLCSEFNNDPIEETGGSSLQVPGRKRLLP
ncbi:MAG TPA: hypothetical protein VJJ22_04475 [Candidatus Paceibacterota bacterium]